MEQTFSNAKPNTYKISFRKIARAAAAEVRVHKKIAIITFVLYGVAMLLFLFNSDISKYSDHPADFYPSGWGIFFAVIGVMAGFFTALNVFRDMNNQQLCDVSMALPIKASERFFSKILCLFYLQIFPLILSTLGGSGLAILFGRLKFGRMESDTAEKLFMLVFGFLAASMFIMSIAVLCACCCGALAESSYFSIILMFVINGLPISFVHNIVERSAGYQSWNIFSLPQSVDLGYWGLLYLISEGNFIPHCVTGCLISLAVMLLSGLIYVRRDARSVGSPIASRVFFEIIMFLGCVTVFSSFAMSGSAWWGLLVAGVAYIIINIIVCRAKINVMSFLKWAGKYFATAAVFSVLLIVTIKTGGFGYINARPDAKYLDGAHYTIYLGDGAFYENGEFVQEAFASDRLSAEKADKVMSICKKHIQKGAADVNPFSVIFGVTDSASVTTVRISASGETPFNYRPSPRFMFQDRWSVNDGENTGAKYYLDYSQTVVISRAEMRALEEELEALGDVYRLINAFDKPSAETVPA